MSSNITQGVKDFLKSSSQPDSTEVRVHDAAFRFLTLTNSSGLL